MANVIKHFCFHNKLECLSLKTFPGAVYYLLVMLQSRLALIANIRKRSSLLIFIITEEDGKFFNTDNRGQHYKTFTALINAAVL
jgi:hypothetical protein